MKIIVASASGQLPFVLDFNPGATCITTGDWLLQALHGLEIDAKFSDDPASDSRHCVTRLTHRPEGLRCKANNSTNSDTELESFVPESGGRLCEPNLFLVN